MFPVRFAGFALALVLSIGVLLAPPALAQSNPPGPGDPGFFEHLLEQAGAAIEGFEQELRELAAEAAELARQEAEHARQQAELDRQRAERAARDEANRRRRAEVEQKLATARAQAERLGAAAGQPAPPSVSPTTLAPPGRDPEPPAAVADPRQVALADEAAGFTLGQRANDAVAAVERRAAEAERRKREADEAAARDQQNLDSLLRRGVDNWRVDQNLAESAGKLQERAEQSAAAAARAGQDLEDARRLRDAHERERQAIVEHERARRSGAVGPELGKAWDKVVEAAKGVLNAGGTPAAILGDGEQSSGQVATPEEQRQRGDLVELANDELDRVEGQIGFEQGRRDKADRDIEHWTASKQKADGQKRKIVVKGKRDPGAESRIAKLDRDMQAADRKLAAARAERERADGKLAELEVRKAKLTRYTGAAEKVAAKEQAVEQAKGLGAEAEGTAKDELEQAQKDLDDAAADLGADDEQADGGAGTTEHSGEEGGEDAKEEPRNSLAGQGADDTERPEQPEVAPVGATVLPPVPLTGAQPWAPPEETPTPTTIDEGEPDPIVLNSQPGQQQRSTYTPPKPPPNDTGGGQGEPGIGGTLPPMGNPCTSQNASAFCGGDGPKGPLVNTPPPPGPTATDDCKGIRVAALCDGGKTYPDTRITTAPPKDSGIRWLSPEEAAFGIVDKDPEPKLAPVVPALSGNLSGSQPTNQGGLDTTIDKLFPSGGGSSSPAAPKPVTSPFVVPGFVGVTVTQPQQAGDPLDSLISGGMSEPGQGQPALDPATLSARCGAAC